MRSFTVQHPKHEVIGLSTIVTILFCLILHFGMEAYYDNDAPTSPGRVALLLGVGLVNLAILAAILHTLTKTIVFESNSIRIQNRRVTKEIPYSSIRSVKLYGVSVTVGVEKDDIEFYIPVGQGMIVENTLNELAEEYGFSIAGTLRRK